VWTRSLGAGESTGAQRDVRAVLERVGALRANRGKRGVGAVGYQVRAGRTTASILPAAVSGAPPPAPSASSVYTRWLPGATP